MEIGPALEDISTKIFFQYPDFAQHYAERLEKAFGLQAPDTDASNSGSCSEYEKIRQSMFELTENFVPIDESIVPPMSIVKEFTGGSTLF